MTNLDHQLTATIAQPLTPLLPRETFAGHDDVLAAYDRMETFNEAIRDHRRRAIECDAAAEVAEAKYADAVTAAVVAGKDDATIKNAAPGLQAKAQVHRNLADKALIDATKHGYVLGDAMAAVAADCFGPADDAMTEAADIVRGSIAELFNAFTTWSVAWSKRETLGRIALYGGTSYAFEAPDSIPAEVDGAVKAIEEHLGSLDRLRDHERKTLEWREANPSMPWDRRPEDVREAEAARRDDEVA